MNHSSLKKVLPNRKVIRLCSVVICFVALGYHGLSQQYVTYKDLTGVNYDASDESITKTSSVGWNAGAYSINCITAGIDGYLYIENVDVSKSVAVGLSSTPSGFDPASMDNAIEFSGGVVRFLERTKVPVVYGAYLATDNFKIARKGGNIEYSVNGVVQHTTPVNNGLELRADVALFDVGAKIDWIQVDFDRCTPTTGDYYATAQRQINDSYYLTHNGVLKAKFIEEYFMGIDTKMTYNILDGTNTVYASVNSNGVPTTGAPNPEVVEGDNRFYLDLSNIGLIGDQFYTIEFINKKEEKRFITFKYITP